MTQTITHIEIEHRFGYHRATFPTGYDPNGEASLVSFKGQHDLGGDVATAPIHAAIRKAFIDLADEILALTGEPSREQSLSLTALQEASMWANAAVAMTSPLVRE